MSDSPGKGFVLLVGVLAVGPVIFGQVLPQGQEPAFRARVDLARFDVTVLDSNHRPVSGLTAADFTITEDGHRRPIAAFEAMTAPESVSKEPAWLQDVSSDVASNRLDGRRLVVIVMDDRSMPFDPGIRKAAVNIATGVIDRLGADDQAAVVFAAYGTNQNFTTDRAALRTAVESLVPHPQSLKGTDVLSNIADVLSDAPVGRKIVIYVSGVSILGTSLHPRFLDQIRRLQAANVVVYSFDPRGLVVGGATAASSGRGRPSRLGPALVLPSPTSLPNSTGGRAFGACRHCG